MPHWPSSQIKSRYFVDVPNSSFAVYKQRTSAAHLFFPPAILYRYNSSLSRPIMLELNLCPRPTLPFFIALLEVLGSSWRFYGQDAKKSISTQASLNTFIFENKE